MIYLFFAANMKAIVCDQDDAVNKILDVAPPCLKLIIATDRSNPIIVKSHSLRYKSISTQIKNTTLDRAENMGVQIVKFRDVEMFGMFGHVTTDVTADSGINRKNVRVSKYRNLFYICFTRIIFYGGYIILNGLKLFLLYYRSNRCIE